MHGLDTVGGETAKMTAPAVAVPLTGSLEFVPAPPGPLVFQSNGAMVQVASSASGNATVTQFDGTIAFQTPGYSVSGAVRADHGVATLFIPWLFEGMLFPPTSFDVIAQVGGSGTSWWPSGIDGSFDWSKSQ